MHTLGKSMTLSVAVLMGAAIAAKAAEPAGDLPPEEWTPGYADFASA